MKKDYHKNTQKPPIGVVPRLIHNEMVMENRMKALSDAINRYTKAKLPIPTEWVTEYNDLQAELD